ncbi:MAG: ABC transporter substrate-binding protein [Halobacteria archaeon]
MNVVSMLPSATEILYALGVEPVGVSHECNYPAYATTKPEVTSTTLSEEGSSDEINRSIAEAEDGDIYRVDVDKLRELEPDLVLTQDVCSDCAIDSSEVSRAIEKLDLEPEVLSLHPHTVNDVLEDVTMVGAATGREERAEEVVDDLVGRMDAVEDRTDSLDRPKTVVIEWMDPVMTGGTLEPGDGQNSGGRSVSHEPWCTIGNR